MRVSLLLTAKPSCVGDLALCVGEELGRAASLIPHEVGIRAAIRRGDADFEGTHFGRLVGSLRPFDVLVDLWADGDAQPPLAALEGLGDRLRSLLFEERSMVLAGPQWRYFGQGGPISIEMLLVRKAGMSRAEMIAYWQNSHTAIPALPRMTSYLQLHVDDTAAQRAAEVTGLRAGRVDGIAEPHYRDVDHFYRCFFDPAVHEVAAADEQLFLEHRLCSAALVTSRWFRRASSARG